MQREELGVDSDVKKAVDSYSALLKSIYLQDESEIAKHPAGEINAVRPQADMIQKSFTDYGMNIVDATVESTIEKVDIKADEKTIQVLVQTRIQSMIPGLSDFEEKQESTWNDIHTLIYETRGLNHAVEEDLLKKDLTVLEARIS
ncbi:hypothetical protein KIMH_10140 [Bombiscardovia apis]|uniref:Uncharacterized protein n=1 Tax=Bombiscardovia apis TaxID=2932182 RepID=A0ABM8BDB9_9BIFI|nr:hypothetical protein KIMH_10140 [Bombiscardovia apis]